MRPHARYSAPLFAAVVAIALAISGPTLGAAITLVSPESVGMSSAGLKAYCEALQGLVKQNRLAGVTTLVARHGKVVMYDAYGHRDLDA